MHKSGRICHMFLDRINYVKEKLSEQKLDAVLISSTSDILYLSGFANFSKEEREAFLIITRDNQFIVTDGRYIEAVKNNVEDFKLVELSSRNNFENIIKKLAGKAKSLGIEENNLTVLEYKILKKYFKKIENFHVKGQRAIKSAEEIEKIKGAADLADKAFKQVIKKIKVGVTEKQVAYELEKFVKDQGAEFSFPAIVAFGKNSSVPHHQSGETKLEKRNGQFILLDFGAKVENYCSDMTRVIFFGTPSKRQKEIYKTVCEAQQKAVDFLNSKILSNKKIAASDVDKLARGYIEIRRFPTIPHSLGHGIGLEVHEHPYISPKSKEELKMGMVFSIEPGIYIPDFGGVRIEDLYVYEKKGLKQLTNSSKGLISL